jgi:hypothetical protein
MSSSRANVHSACARCCERTAMCFNRQDRSALRIALLLLDAREQKQRRDEPRQLSGEFRLTTQQVVTSSEPRTFMQRIMT